ncbi:kinesin-like protein KIF6 isoform X1 [Larimichthys crocea]|uniref:kinesin-like protein KIF6 isoform X1 n=1 Tax=Larimichthys crocea TaxID=215358 RepID=UPI00090114FF|nr:kinesin-like protein KIF6 isoform X1 [Larimichthys crocea]
MVKHTIQIFGRVRPTKKTPAVYSVDSEDQTGASLQFVVPRDLADGFVNNKRECYKFRFQKVFDQAAKQEEIFENIAKPVADSVLAGYNGTIFAYGQTGSGKTFTITGGAERYSDRGIIPRTLSYLFERFSQDSSMVYTTHISYLEIYNEMGYDLLNSQHEASRLEDLPKVMIMEDPDQIIHLRNLSLKQSTNEEDALNLLFLGDTNRMIAETPMNQASTRSHCIFTVHLCRREPGSATLRRSKLHLVDLAGSDRVSKTGLNGQLLTEAKYINLSLHYLEQVIIALSEKNRSHIPYRNSMLTSVLRDSLGGNCMTTMIATMAVDKRNLDESISTCRFAQRVALIKNEAILNEELDPALLIARLKRENQALKEELVMMAGKPREDQLTVEEIQKLEELVKAFLDDPDPDLTLSLGPDMRKIQYCFSLLKVMLMDKQGQRRNRCSDEQESPAATVSEEVIEDSHHSATEVTELKKTLTQRNNEISILVKMLKKEKKAAKDAAAQLANITNGQNLASQSALRVSTPPSSRDGSTETISPDHAGRAKQYMKRGPQLSMGKQEAFEIFIRDHEDHLTVEDNKKLLKHRSAEAKRLGAELIEVRDRINELKTQLVMQRRQRAAHGVMENHTEAEEEVDPVQEKLCIQIKQENKAFKNIVSHLKALRTEIEHLQLLLERAKVKLQKDFLKWWSQEASSVQDSESEAAARCHAAPPSGTLQPSSPGTPGFRTPNVSSAVRYSPVGQDPNPNSSTASVQDLRSFIPKTVPPLTAVPAWHEESLDRRVTPSSEWRALSPTKLSSSSIPLTGDQQTDADILAFVRARQNLLTRTGPPQ